MVIANGSGISPGTVRTDLESADRIDSRDGPTACTYRMDVEHGEADRTAVNFSLSRNDRCSLMDQGNVATRSAHVKGDNVLDACSLTDA